MNRAPSKLTTATLLPSAAGSALIPTPGEKSRQVRRTDDAVRGCEIGGDLLPAPGVVAERDRIGAGGKDALCVPGRKTRSVRGVLGVDEAEIDRQLLAQAGQLLLEHQPPRRAEDVSEKQDAQAAPPST